MILHKNKTRQNAQTVSARRDPRAVKAASRKNAQVAAEQSAAVNNASSAAVQPAPQPGSADNVAEQPAEQDARAAATAVSPVPLTDVNPNPYSDERIARLVQLIDEADAVVVGGASGMSAAGGDSWYDVNPMFLKYYGDLYEKYGERAGGIFQLLYSPLSEKDRVLAVGRTMQLVSESTVPQQYWDLKELLEGKDYFVLTTNQDQLFRRTFGDDKTAFIQGDWGWLQCSERCHDGLYSNKEFVEHVAHDTVDGVLPEEYEPHCPRCGAPMIVWARDPRFLEGAMYAEQYHKLNEFLKANLNKKVLFFELGVGAMTPMFIKEPFWNYTFQWPGGANYVPITLGHAVVPREIDEQSLAFDAEIDKVLHRAAELKRGEDFVTQSDEFKQERPIDCSDAIAVGW